VRSVDKMDIVGLYYDGFEYYYSGIHLKCLILLKV